jgi:hypothetical protein
MKAGAYRKHKTALKSIFAATIGGVFLLVQISPRFYLLSSRPIFHSHVQVPSGQFSGGTFHYDHYAVLSFDKRFAVQKQIFFSPPYFASPFPDSRPLLVVLCPDKITHCHLLTQGEELRGPPTT